MSAEDSSNPSNLGRAGLKAKVSAQEEYARFQLLKEKLGAGHAFVVAKSEKEEIMGDILARIAYVRESTPEWSELVHITQTEDRAEQAERLAEKAWTKRQEELIMSKYTGGRDKMDATYNKSQQEVSRVRGTGGLFELVGGLGAENPAKAPLTLALESLFGARRA